MKIRSILALLMVMVQLSYGQPDWISRYYENPVPEDFPGKIRSLMEGKDQERREFNPQLVGFMSQVMKQNPDKVFVWLVDLENLQEKNRTTVLVAAWFSNTDGSKKYFEDRGLGQYLETKPQDLLAVKVESPETLDLLWGMFLASGDIEPLRRIVSSLELSQYEGALERYKLEEQTEEARKAAFMEATFRAAVWSLEEQCKQHARVLSLCEDIYAKDHLTKRQRENLAGVLANFKPSVNDAAKEVKPISVKAGND